MSATAIRATVGTWPVTTISTCCEHFKGQVFFVKMKTLEFDWILLRYFVNGLIECCLCQSVFRDFLRLGHHYRIAGRMRLIIYLTFISIFQSTLTTDFDVGWTCNSSSLGWFPNRFYCHWRLSRLSKWAAPVHLPNYAFMEIYAKLKYIRYDLRIPRSSLLQCGCLLRNRSPRHLWRGKWTGKWWCDFWPSFLRAARAGTVRNDFDNFSQSKASF